MPAAQNHQTSRGHASTGPRHPSDQPSYSVRMRMRTCSLIRSAQSRPNDAATPLTTYPRSDSSATPWSGRIANEEASELR
jgi:hypothetical protein